MGASPEVPKTLRAAYRYATMKTRRRALVAEARLWLYRFRKHQQPLKQYRPTPFWSSAQTYLQLIVGVEAAALLFIVLVINHASLVFAGTLSTISLLALSILQERRLRRGPLSRA